MSRRIVLDIGTHKTGSTSRQLFMQERAAVLRARGVDWFTGSLIPSNHVELHMACMDEARSSPARLLFPAEADRPALYARTAERVRSFLETSDARTLVFSAEGLSFLRSAAEIERLRALFPGETVEISVYLREKSGFLASYRRQLTATGIPFSDDPDSFAYVGEDSWLLDYGRFATTFGAAFGPENLRMFDYDVEMRDHGSVVAHFVSEVLNLDSEGEDLDAFWSNVTSRRDTLSET